MGCATDLRTPSEAPLAFHGPLSNPMHMTQSSDHSKVVAIRSFTSIFDIAAGIIGSSILGSPVASPVQKRHQNCYRLKLLALMIAICSTRSPLSTPISCSLTQLVAELARGAMQVLRRSNKNR